MANDGDTQTKGTETMCNVEAMMATGYYIEWTGRGELVVRGGGRVMARAAHDGTVFVVTTAWGTFPAPNVATALLTVATMEAAATMEAGPYKRAEYLT